MIRVFGQSDLSFVSNGNVVISPLRAKVFKKDNGDFYLDLVTGLEFVNWVVDGNIVVANTPQGDQAFRIGNITKSKNKISAKCMHVFYDSKNYLIADSYVENKTAQEALVHLNNATEPQSPFSMASDISEINSLRCIRKSLYEAIQAVLERWGGHLVRDNFSVQIRSEIGTDNGVTVEYRKNLKEITCEEKWDNVVTKLLPVGKDGLLLNAIDSSASIYVESQIQYEIPFVKTVSFSQGEIRKEEYSTEHDYMVALVADLREKATAYVEENSLPKVNYTMRANLERITDIGDVVEVKDSRLGIDLLTHVIGFEYDCILGKYTQIEFGTFKETLSGLVSTITSSVDKDISGQIQAVSDELNAEIKQATDYIMESVVIGVKGEEESLYRKGNVSVSRENIGVDRVTNFDIEDIVSN